MFRSSPGFEYSARKIAVVTPIGTTTIMQRAVNKTVPTMTGKMPPFVIASTGGFVIKSQLRMLTPLYATKKRMMRRITAPVKPRLRMSERKNPSLMLNFFPRTRENGCCLLCASFVILFHRCEQP